MKLRFRWCGDDYCNCHWFIILDENDKKVFESSWFDPVDLYENEKYKNEILNDVNEACTKFSLPLLSDKIEDWYDYL